MQYCKVKEGGTCPTTFALCKHLSNHITSLLIKTKEDAKASLLDKVLEVVIVLVYREKRLKIYFLYLRNNSLLINKRVFLFSTPSNLSKYFK